MTQNRYEYQIKESDEHILVCLSSAPSNAKIIRTAARMANVFHSQFTALFVETPDFSVASKENKNRLQENRKLAEQLGANIEIVYGEDIPYQIAEFARISDITRIVLGHSTVTRRHLFGKPTLTELLLSYAPDIDIHIIPDKTVDTSYYPKKAKQKFHSMRILKNSFTSALILLCATLLSLLFHGIGFTSPNIIMVYILGVLLTSIVTSHQVYSLISSIASVFVFNYLFTEPRFSLTAYETGYPITFVVMFLTAYITGAFAIRYKEQARQSTKIAHRTKILFDTDQMLSKAHGRSEIIKIAAEQVMKLLGRNIVVFENLKGQLSEPILFYTDSKPEYDIEKERRAAQWALENNYAADSTNEFFLGIRYFYWSIRANERVYGVIGIDSSAGEIDASEHDVLLSILGETALALENDRNIKEKEAAAVLAENEQLRANLLRTISHDLRTPLTTISGNASNLLNNAGCFDKETKQQIYADIYNDSIWLADLVENLLYATRIEDGYMILQTSTELLSEIIEVAIQHISRKAVSHSIKVIYEGDFLLVKADAKLIVQVITNIIDNALKYTPDGTKITLKAEKTDNMAQIMISDTGDGLSDEQKQKVFDKFYCGENKIADNRRSLGLGLFLCKAIVEAHGGTICVKDNHPKGTTFSFTLPLEEVICRE
ncbi:MAG: DUF4118 domain-containing protein [Clostridia bacterium]|nr:DUF4118 domain-containing protein [Clostridia bacterium]